MSDALPVEITQHYPLPLTQLPAGWKRVWLTDVASSISPGFASGKHSTAGKGVPHLRPMNIDRDGQIDLAVVKLVASSEGIELDAGDVLFNNTNSPELVGKTALISAREAGFAYSNHMTRIRLEPGVVPAFVARQLHFLWMSGYLKSRCTNHVNQASISSTTLASTVPLLLAPAAEQRRIFERLEAALSDLDDGVQELEAAQKKLARYRHALLKAAVDGELTAEWRHQRMHSGERLETGKRLLDRILQERRDRWEKRQLARFEEQGKTPPKGWLEKYVAPVEAETSNLPALPDQWVWASAEQLCEFITKGTTPPRDLEDSGPKVVPFLRVTNLTDDGRLDLSDKVFVSEQTHRDFLARSIVYPGDVLMNIVGPPLGQVSVVPSDFAEWNINQAIAIFRAVDGVVPGFVSLVLQSPGSKRWLQQRAKTTAGQTNLTLEACRRLPMPLPPVSEQLELVRQVGVLLEALAVQQGEVVRALKQSHAQRSNLFRAAFAGKLVAQNPSEESAGALLERIRASRAELKQSPMTRKTRLSKEDTSVVKKILEVLAEAGDWLPAQEAFRRCGVAESAHTDQIEAIYAELRELDKAKRLAVEAVNDAHGRKLHGRLKLLPAA